MLEGMTPPHGGGQGNCNELQFPLIVRHEDAELKCVLWMQEHVVESI